MQNFSSWLGKVIVENANPVQLITQIQNALATQQQELTTKTGLLQQLADLSKKNPNALAQLAPALQIALQKNDFKTLQDQFNKIGKQPAQQQSPQQNAQQPPAGNANKAGATPQAVPAPATGAQQPQRI